MTRQRLSPLHWGILLGLLLLAGMVAASIGASSFALSLNDLLAAVTGEVRSMAAQLILTVRLPRVLVAAAAGAALALAGTLMQGMTRNPLASPALFGINAGAACMMVVAQVGLLGWLSQWPLLLVTALGAALSGALVLVLGGALSGRIHPVRIVLAGVALTAMLTALTRALLIMDEQAQAVLDWLSGSLADTRWQDWHSLWPVLLIAGAGALWLARGLNLLALGEEVATGLGVSPLRIRLQASLLVTLLAAATVAVTGPIAFVGLLVPHFARALVGHDHHRLLPVAALLGAALMVWADLLSRWLVFSAETPVGLVTALVGAPCFLWLAARRTGGL